MIHDQPANGTYEVGVFYAGGTEFGKSFATVEFYIGGQLEKEYKNMFISPGTFIHVADMVWESGEATIRRIKSKSEGFP